MSSLLFGPRPACGPVGSSPLRRSALRLYVSPLRLRPTTARGGTSAPVIAATQGLGLLPSPPPHLARRSRFGGRGWSTGVRRRPPRGALLTARQRHQTIEIGRDALLDDLGARDTLVELLDDCIGMSPGDAASDPDHPFTVFFVFTVPRVRLLQFEAWVQQTITCQNMRFPGYKGTLIYRPDSTLSGPQGGDHSTYLLDLRYRGADNLKAWLMSGERDVLYSQAERQSLWVREATRLRVVEGNNGSVENLWKDPRTEAAHQQTSFSKWRVVVFKCLNVWLAVLVCGWPGMSLASALKTLGLPKLAVHSVTVAVAVAVVVFFCVPLTQPWVAHLLVEKSRAHPDVLEAEADLMGDEDLRYLSMVATTEEHVGAAKAEARVLLDAAGDETLGLSPASNGVVTVVLNHNVKPGRFEAFEDACQDVAAAAERFPSGGFVGHTLVRPASGSNVYTLIFRYDSREALAEWLSSDVRARFVAKMYKLVQSPAEVKVHNYSAVDLLLTGFDRAPETQPPPPVWKTFFLITCSLYTFSLVSLYFIGPRLTALGVPYPLVVLATSFFNCGSHSYTLTPVLSKRLAPWLMRQTPVPKWLDEGHPLVRWPTKGFRRGELAAILCFYIGWACGRWRPLATAMA